MLRFPLLVLLSTLLCFCTALPTPRDPPARDYQIGLDPAPVIFLSKSAPSPTISPMDKSTKIITVLSKAAPTPTRKVSSIDFITIVEKLTILSKSAPTPSAQFEIPAKI